MKVSILGVYRHSQDYNLPSTVSRLDNDGAGDCALFAFDDALQLAFEDHDSFTPELMRSMLVTWVQANLDNPVMPDGDTPREHITIHNIENNRSMDEYLRYIGESASTERDGAFLGDLELTFLSVMFDVNLDTYRITEGNQSMLVSRLDINEERPTVSLEWGNNHWQVLVDTDTYYIDPAVANIERTNIVSEANIERTNIVSDQTSQTNRMSTQEDLKFDDHVAKIKKSIRDKMSSKSQSSEAEEEKLFNVKGRFVERNSDTDTSEHSFLVGYDQTNLAPKGYDSSDRANCPIVAMIHDGEEKFRAEMSDLKDINGNPINWNLVSKPYHRKADSKQPLVVLALHYQTTEELSFQKLSDTEGLVGHAARGRRSDGTLRSFTPQWLSQSMGPENFNNAVFLDMIPFAHPIGGSPTDVLSASDYAKCMESWSRNVLQPLHGHKGTSIALCSKETAKLYAKYAVGGTIKDLDKVFEDNPSKLISAEDDRLVVAYHPCSMYNPLHWSNMGLKTRTTDEFYTGVRKRSSGNNDVEECTFARSIFEENSEAFQLMQEKYLAGCRLGGRTTQEMRREANWYFYILMEDGYSREDALNWIESEMSPEHRNLIQAYEASVESTFQANKVACLTYCKKNFEGVETDADLTFAHKSKYKAHHSSTLGNKRLEEKHGVEGAKEVRTKRRYKQAKTLGDEGRKKAAANAYKTRTGKDAVEWSDEQEAEVSEFMNDTPTEYISYRQGKPCISWKKVIKDGLFPGRTDDQLKSKAKNLKRSASRKRKREESML